ncbi:MAG: YitT family protein [Sellimonas intestinalis]
MLFWIAIGAGIAHFGIHNIHERIWNHGGWSDRDDVVHPSLVWFAGWLITPVLDVSCYLLALRFLGTRFIKVSILSTFCVSTFYNLWELFPYLLPDLSDYPLAAAVFGGIFVGIGVGTHCPARRFQRRR